MKKIKINKGMSVLLASMLLAGSIVIGCSSDDVDTQEVTSEPMQEVTSESKQAEEPKEETKAFKEVVLVNNEYCKIVITGIADSFCGYGYNTLVENKSDIPLLIGFNDVSVDGMMCEPCWATEIMPGKKDKVELVWYDDSIKSMDDLVNIEGTFNISNADNWNTLGKEQVIINKK